MRRSDEGRRPRQRVERCRGLLVFGVLLGNRHRQRRAHRDTAGVDELAGILDTCRATGTTGLLIHSDPQAVLLQQYARDHGWSIPGDLAIVAYDDEVAENAEPAITALRPPKQHVGRLAVESIVGRLTDGVDRPIQRTYLLPTLHARESSRALSGS